MFDIFFKTTGVILRIRIYQLFRTLAQLGIFRSLFLAFMLAFFGLLPAIKLSFDGRATTVAVFLSIIIAGIHLSRKDKSFLSLIGVCAYKMYLTEYLALTIPFIIIFLIKTEFIAILITGGIVFLVPLVLKTENLFFQNIFKLLVDPESAFEARRRFSIPIDAGLFELKAGLRKYALMFVTLIVTSISLSFTEWATPLSIALQGVTFASCYLYGESREMLESLEASPKQFLAYKIKLQLRYTTILLLPQIISYLIFNPELWFIIAFATFIAIFMPVFSIITKYSTYESGEDLGYNLIFIWLSFIGLLLPVFVPIPGFLIIRNYFKAINNLNFYLDAYNKQT